MSPSLIYFMERKYYKKIGVKNLLSNDVNAIRVGLSNSFNMSNKLMIKWICWSTGEILFVILAFEIFGFGLETENIDVLKCRGSGENCSAMFV